MYKHEIDIKNLANDLVGANATTIENTLKAVCNAIAYGLEAGTCASRDDTYATFDRGLDTDYLNDDEYAILEKYLG